MKVKTEGALVQQIIAGYKVPEKKSIKRKPWK